MDTKTKKRLEANHYVLSPKNYRHSVSIVPSKIAEYRKFMDDEFCVILITEENKETGEDVMYVIPYKAITKLLQPAVPPNGKFWRLNVNKGYLGGKALESKLHSLSIDEYERTGNFTEQYDLFK